MKKVIKLTLAVVLMMGATSTFAQKFGRINSEEIIAVMPETKEMQTNMQAYVKNLQDEMEALQVEYNNKLQDFQKNYETLSEAVRDMKSKDLESIANRIREFEQVAREDIQKKQYELLTPIYEKVNNAIEKVSKAGGYLAVFNIAAGSLAYFDEAALTDLAPAIRQELGIPENAQPISAN